MLWSAIILGLLGSFHCIGMCGPIAFLLPVDRSNPLRKTIQIFLYHFGRILAYSSIGLIFGLIGKSASIFGMQQQLSIVIGILMILFVLLPKKFISNYNFSKPMFRVVSKIKTALGKELKKKTPDTFLTIGFLNGFLPCGLVYVAIFASVALGNVWESSLYMALFGVGTIPLMTAAIYLGSIITGSVKSKIRRAIPVFVVIFGCLFILRGMGLGIPYISPKQMVETVDSNYQCHDDLTEVTNLNN